MFVIAHESWITAGFLTVCYSMSMVILGASLNELIQENDVLMSDVAKIFKI